MSIYLAFSTNKIITRLQASLSHCNKKCFSNLNITPGKLRHRAIYGPTGSAESMLMCSDKGCRDIRKIYVLNLRFGLISPKTDYGLAKYFIPNLMQLSLSFTFTQLNAIWNVSHVSCLYSNPRRTHHTRKKLHLYIYQTGYHAAALDFRTHHMWRNNVHLGKETPGNYRTHFWRQNSQNYFGWELIFMPPRKILTTKICDYSCL